MYGEKKLVPAVVRWSVTALAAYAVIGGAVTLIGWFAGLPRLTDWADSGIAMFANTALAAGCSGVALILATLNPRWCARVSGVLGVLVALLGGATLFQHLSGVNLGIDTLLIRPDWGHKAAVSPGRMGPPASTCFLMLGVALVLIANGRARFRRIAPRLGLAVCILAAVALMGYISGADPLFAVARYTGIAMQTASILLALALAAIASVPECEPMRTVRQDSAAGLLVRRSLPFIIALPIAIGYLRVRAQHAGWFDTAMGTSLLTLMLVVLFCGLLGWWAKALARYEGELRHRTEQLETLINRAPLGVYLVDADFRLARVNPIALPVFGNVPGGMVGRDFDDVIHLFWKKEYADEVARIFRHTLQTGESYFTPERAEYRIDLKRMEYYEWRLDRIPCPDGRNGLVCYFRDIGQQVEARKKIEESRDALRESERLQRLLAELGELGTRLPEAEVFIEAICERVGKEFGVSHCGYTITDLKAGTFTVTKDYHADRRSLAGVYPISKWATTESFSNHIVASEDLATKPSTAGEYDELWGSLDLRSCLSVPLHREGRLAASFWVGHHEPRRWTEREIELVKLVADRVWLVVERNLAEKALRENAAGLEATVAERTAKLQETVSELQNLSYSIAHDMRAPLRAMGTFAQLLMSELPAANASPEIKTYCERIVIGAARLDNLINDALNYTKAVLQEFPLQTVDLSSLVRGLVDTYPNLHVQSANITIDESLPVVLGNESLLTQCFSNLLGNAVKFVTPGGRPNVRVWSEVENGSARVWVEDNGIGIPKHAQPRLFAMFQKLDNRYEGTGVGLAIVRKVVERMGGKVGVESEPDRGSRFWVELRVAPEKESV